MVHFEPSQRRVAGPFVALFVVALGLATAPACGTSNICDGDDCSFDCTGGACVANCEAGGHCDVACEDALACTVNCDEGATCNVDCGSSTACTVNCDAGATCAIQCADAGSCTVNCDEEVASCTK